MHLLDPRDGSGLLVVTCIFCLAIPHPNNSFVQALAKKSVSICNNNAEHTHQITKTINTIGTTTPPNMGREYFPDHSALDSPKSLVGRGGGGCYGHAPDPARGREVEGSGGGAEDPRVRGPAGGAGDDGDLVARAREGRPRGLWVRGKPNRGPREEGGGGVFGGPLSEGGGGACVAPGRR